MDRVPLIGIYRKGSLPPAPLQRGEVLPQEEGSGSSVPKHRGKSPPFCIVTMMDWTTSALLLETWRREGVRLLRSAEAARGPEAGVWVRLLSAQSRGPAGRDIPGKEVSEENDPGIAGLIPSSSFPSPLRNNEISAPAIPRARPWGFAGEAGGLSRYVAHLYARGVSDTFSPAGFSHYA